MRTLPPKRPEETVRYVEDFTNVIGDDAIVTATVVADPPPGATLTVEDSGIDGKTVWALISGGDPTPVTVGLTVTVVTDGEQTIERFWQLYVADVAQSVWPTTTTKGQIVSMAFEEIGLAGYEFDATPEEQASALRRLDTLIAMWAGPGFNLNIGYFQTGGSNGIGLSDLADASGIPDFALDAVVVKLALSIMPAIGKTMSAETRMRMNESWTALRAAFARIPERQLPPSTLRGAGAKPFSTWTPYNGAGNGGR